MSIAQCFAAWLKIQNLTSSANFALAARVNTHKLFRCLIRHVSQSDGSARASRDINWSTVACVHFRTKIEWPKEPLSLGDPAEHDVFNDSLLGREKCDMILVKMHLTNRSEIRLNSTHWRWHHHQSSSSFSPCPYFARWLRREPIRRARCGYSRWQRKRIHSTKKTNERKKEASKDTKSERERKNNNRHSCTSILSWWFRFISKQTIIQ